MLLQFYYCGSPGIASYSRFLWLQPTQVVRRYGTVPGYSTGSPTPVLISGTTTSSLQNPQITIQPAGIISEGSS